MEGREVSAIIKDAIRMGIFHEIIKNAMLKISKGPENSEQYIAGLVEAEMACAKQLQVYCDTLPELQEMIEDGRRQMAILLSGV